MEHLLDDTPAYQVLADFLLPIDARLGLGSMPKWYNEVVQRPR